MLINYKNIEDTLTTAELNAYASLLAHNKILIDIFRLKNGTIAGNYGEYTFDLSTASIVDNGILITDETLSNNITVKLSNPTQYATYTLHFSVVRYGDASILDEPTDNIETFDLSLDLVDGETVNIPLTDLQEYDIILFDTLLTVKHDKPEISGEWIDSLAIDSDKAIIQTNDYADITGTLLTNNGDGVSGETLWFYEKYIPTLLKLACDTSIIQTNEYADLTATLKDEDGSLVEGAVIWFYERYIPSILNIKSDKQIIQTDDQADITATLKDEDGSLVKGAVIYFYVKEEA